MCLLLVFFHEFCLQSVFLASYSQAVKLEFVPTRSPLSLRIAVFSVSVFYDERIVVVAEQRPDASEEDSFQWMSRVLQVSPLPWVTRSLCAVSSARGQIRGHGRAPD